MEKNKIHNMRDNTVRYLAGLIVKQKSEIIRLKKWLKALEDEHSKALQLLHLMENHPQYEKQGRKVSEIGQKIEAINEAIAQYQSNLIKLGVEV